MTKEDRTVNRLPVSKNNRFLVHVYMYRPHVCVPVSMYLDKGTEYIYVVDKPKQMHHCFNQNLI